MLMDAVVEVKVWAGTFNSLVDVAKDIDHAGSVDFLLKVRE